MFKFRIILKQAMICFIALLLLGSTFPFQSYASTTQQPNLPNKIDQYIQKMMTEYQIPGLSIALVHHDKTVYSHGWGITGGKKTAVTSDTPFALGSLSKSLTGLAIVKLIEEKKMELDKPIQTYIPWFTLQDKKASSQITVRHLLAQTSGISTYSGLEISDQGSLEPDAIKKNVKKLSSVELNSAPGATHQYSAANYLILGAIIEEITNMPYADYMEQEIFVPLQMKHAASDYEKSLANGYLSGFQSWFGVPKPSKVMYDNSGAPYGYITASAKDMAQYLKAVINGNDVINGESHKLFLSPLVERKPDQWYGFGWRTSKISDSETMIWHAGSTPDSRAEILLNPKTGWGLVILTNKDHIFEEPRLTYVAKEIMKMVNGEVPDELPKATATEQWIVSGVVLVLLLTAIGLFIRLQKHKPTQKVRMLWFILGFGLVLLAIGLIPALTYILDSPWRALEMFAPDIAFLTYIGVMLLASKGLIAILISLEKFRKSNKTTKITS
ncbi:serine hydrolase domain-containing protein [Risungbinella massiliensis]|uniref:serine hydrolase domain-containing protein n=1 Tax=Risungbinella massiliensis TaxID=1329796 RepID=UPI001E32909D|nr:serine hydrolase domain-containing protein [Risungbinella massiliensis]